MSRKLAPWLVALAAAGTAAVTAAPAAADVIMPIGPDQYFVGVVNDHTDHATIWMDCGGPISQGHPHRGQTVEALMAPVITTSDAGFTGSAAHAIDVRFPTPVSVNSPVVLRAYGAKAEIPVSLTLPCSGTGKVAFVPDPTSPTARPATVDVSFVSIGVQP